MDFLLGVLFLGHGDMSRVDVIGSFLHGVVGRCALVSVLVVEVHSVDASLVVVLDVAVHHGTVLGVSLLVLVLVLHAFLAAVAWLPCR
jgi:hypothetical protein